ncbi:hypothetical protein HPB52_006631 [Rhipicephalus sanguineus]|uniref:Uncharacterized protein n=1 Tax=Rhipicephalus sanguineus TaxID=34632 RepID=A0A9D4QFN8_RHISA|nr:hypothetical protein HPB52_006631 [Rhipicephalus sanguineus]
MGAAGGMDKAPAVSSLSCRRSDDQRSKAFGVIREYHPGLGNPAGISVCGKCKDTLVSGKLPSFSTANGYEYLGCPKVY